MSEMIKNDIKLRQVAFVFLALMPVNKVLMLPSILAHYCAEQLYLPLILNLLFDGIMLFLILKIGERYPRTTIFEILQINFGEKLTKVFCFLLGSFFFLKSFVPILEQKYFVDNTLYEVFPNFISFFPLLFLSAYASIKGLKALGRAVDISVFFTILGFLTIIYFSVSSANFNLLLPIFQKPHYNTLNASFSSIIWFMESAYMLLFIGHFKPTKKYKTKIITCFSIGALFVIAISVIFYGVFGSVSYTQLFAASDITIYTTKIINIGRFDYLATFMLLFSKVFAICMPAYSATKFFEKAFGCNKAIIPAFIVNGLLLIGIFVFEDKFFSLFIFSVKYLNWFFVTVGYALPLIFFILLRGKQREKV